MEQHLHLRYQLILFICIDVFSIRHRRQVAPVLSKIPSFSDTPSPIRHINVFFLRAGLQPRPDVTFSVYFDPHRKFRRYEMASGFLAAYYLERTTSLKPPGTTNLASWHGKSVPGNVNINCWQTSFAIGGIY